MRIWGAGQGGRMVIVAMLLAAGAAAGCGKKGPPLAPIVPTPARIADLAVRRVGETVQVRVLVPDTNQDGTRPVDLERIDVYAFTGMAESDIPDVKYATLVGHIAVQRHVSAEEREVWATRNLPPPPNPGVAPATPGYVTEILTPAMRQAVVPLDAKGKPVSVPVVLPDDRPVPRALSGPVPPVEPKRFYMAVGVSRRGVKGMVSVRRPVPLGAIPPPPVGLTAAAGEAAVTVTWKAPAEQREPIQAPAVDGVLNATPKGVATSVVYAYNLYLTTPTVAGQAEPAVSGAREPMSATPLTDTRYTDTAAVFGQERCYVVRAVDAGVEGPAIGPVCLTPTDVFPPPAPTNLAAIGSEGSVSLIWEAVDAADLAGYVVLRADGPDQPLMPLFDVPLVATAYRDTSAKPGVKYVYAVVAVDTASPRNTSAPSNRVDEAAR